MKHFWSKNKNKNKSKNKSKNKNMEKGLAFNCQPFLRKRFMLNIIKMELFGEAQQLCRSL